MSKQQFIPQIDDNQYINSTHKVNLTGGEISTILYHLEECNSTPELERIFVELQSVTDNYYAQLEAQNENNYAECVDRLVNTMGGN